VTARILTLAQIRAMSPRTVEAFEAQRADRTREVYYHLRREAWMRARSESIQSALLNHLRSPDGSYPVSGVDESGLAVTP
jgi:hypothetical protein